MLHRRYGGWSMKACTKCKSTDNGFTKSKNRPDGLKSWCKLCTREASKQYQRDNRGKVAARMRTYRHDNREEIAQIGRTYKQEYHEELLRKDAARKAALKLLVFQAYGMACSCCKTSVLIHLTIDHIDGNGGTHRRNIGRKGGSSFYQWLVKNNYPVGYQAMCFNCNFAKHILGCCPCHIVQ